MNRTTSIFSSRLISDTTVVPMIRSIRSSAIWAMLSPRRQSPAHDLGDRESGRLGIVAASHQRTVVSTCPH
jgi:hypothetical protein